MNMSLRVFLLQSFWLLWAEKREIVAVIPPLFGWPIIIIETRPWCTSKMMHEPHYFVQGQPGYFRVFGYNWVPWTFFVNYLLETHNWWHLGYKIAWGDQYSFPSLKTDQIQICGQIFNFKRFYLNGHLLIIMHNCVTLGHMNQYCTLLSEQTSGCNYTPWKKL